MGSEVIFRALNKWRIQLGSVQGHRCTLRNAASVMHKGRTKPDAVHGPRGGPRSIDQKLKQICAGECFLEAYPMQDSALFTTGT